MTGLQPQDRVELHEALTIVRNIVKGKWNCEPGDMSRILKVLEAYERQLGADHE